MKIKNIRYMLLMLVVSFFLFPIIHVYAIENTIDATLPVIQEFELLTQGSSETDTVGIYELKSIDNNSPMPGRRKEQSYIFQIDGVDKQAIMQFKYERAGIYKYQLHQVLQDKKNYIYDKSVYDLKVYIKKAENGKVTQQIIVRLKQVMRVIWGLWVYLLLCLSDSLLC